MTRQLSKWLLSLLVGLVVAAGAQAKEQAVENPVVVVTTSMGVIEIELYADKSPNTVKNFLAYVDKGFYDGTIFHRVIPNFMIQGGGFDKAFKQKDTADPIENEADNGVKNQKGTIAMARTGDPHSATAQFFINVADNEFLNHKSKDARGWGYCAFGKVTQGLEVCDKIVAVKTTTKGPHQDVPAENVVIESIKRK